MDLYLKDENQYVIKAFQNAIEFKKKSLYC